jgi:hypothetical protein
MMQICQSNIRRNILIYFVLGFIFFACKNEKNEARTLEKNILIKVDKNDTAFSLHVSSNGKSYVVKSYAIYNLGDSSFDVVDSSIVFRLDSTDRFFQSIDLLAKKKKFITMRNVPAQRIQIFHNDSLVYQGYGWDPDFWVSFWPIAEKIPKEFNPFIID